MDIGNLLTLDLWQVPLIQEWKQSHFRSFHEQAVWKQKPHAECLLVCWLLGLIETERDYGEWVIMGHDDGEVGDAVLEISIQSNIIIINISLVIFAHIRFISLSPSKQKFERNSSFRAYPLEQYLFGHFRPPKILWDNDECRIRPGTL